MGGLNKKEEIAQIMEARPCFVCMRETLHLRSTNRCMQCAFKPALDGFTSLGAACRAMTQDMNVFSTLLKAMKHDAK